MSVQIPSALIRQIQTTLRSSAGLPPPPPVSDDPAASDPSLSPLSSLHNAIAALDDASLPRCINCKHSGLLRGAHSTLCIFCGHRHSTPHSVSFASTLACKNFLQSLHLDGSEVVSLEPKPKDSNRNEGAAAPPEAGVPLSSLLNLELKWPPPERESDKVPSASAQPVNLSRVDLGNLFSDPKAPDSVPEKQTGSAETTGSFQDSSSVNAEAGGDSFADWESGFQSASDGAFPGDSKSVDLFQGSSAVAAAAAPVSESVDLFAGSSESASGFDPGWEESNEGEGGGEATGWGEFSTGSNWIQGGKLKASSETDDNEPKIDIKGATFTGDSWGQDEVWPTGSTNEPINNESKHEINDDFDDSLDSWQGFAISNEARGVSSSSWVQSDNEIPLGDNASISKPADLQDMDFDDFFSGAITEPKVPNKVSDTVESASASDSKIEELDNVISISADTLDAWENDQLKSVSKTNDTEVKDGDRWDREDDVWLTSSTKASGDTESKHDNDDAFDDPWQDFVSSNEAPVVSSSSWAISGNEVTSNDEASELKPMDLQDIDFGDFFMGAVTEKKVPTEVSNSQLYASAYDSNIEELDNLKSISGISLDAWENDELNSMSKTINIEVKNETEVKKSTGDSWGQDQVPTNSMEQSGNTESKNDNDDDFDDSWQDFASSNEVPGVSSVSWMQSSNEIPFNENASASKSVDLQDMDFGDFFCGPITKPKGSNEVSDIQFITSASNSNVHELDNLKGINSDSLDAWKDFSSLIGTVGNLSKLSKQTTPESTLNQHVTRTRSADIGDMNFGSFFNLNSFSGALDAQKGPSDSSTLHLEAQVSTKLSKQTTPETTLNQHVSRTRSADLGDMNFGSFFNLNSFSGALDAHKGPSDSSTLHLDAQVFTNSTKEFDTAKGNNDNDDSLEDWQDFTSSKESPADLLNSWTSSIQTSNERVRGRELVNPQGLEFGRSLHSAPFSGLEGEKDSSEVNGIKSDPLSSNKSIGNQFSNGNNNNYDDDLFGSWKEQSTMNKVPEVLLNKTKIHDEGMSNDHTSGEKSMDLQDIDFGDFFHSDFSSATVRQKGSDKVNDVRLDALVSTSGIEKSNTIKSFDDKDDCDDDWQDFTGSTGASSGLGSSSAQISTSATSFKHHSGTKSLDLQDMEFGNFLHSDSFSGAWADQRSFSKANDVQNSSVSNRMSRMDNTLGLGFFAPGAAKTLKSSTSASNLDTSNAITEILSSKMPDLSLMFSDNFPPQKKI